MSSPYDASSMRTNRVKSDQSYRDPPEECAAMTKVLQLPEFFEIIFRYLDVQSKGRVAQVSWMWHDIIGHPRVWRDVTVDFVYDDTDHYEYLFGSVDLDDRQHQRVIPQHSKWKFSQLVISKLAVWSKNSIKMLRLIVGGFKNLELLKVCHRSSNGMEDAELALIAVELKSLQHLDLGRHNYITDVGVATLCGWNGVICDGKVPTLLSLSVQGNDDLTDEALKLLSIGQVALQKLNISHCRNLTDKGLQFLTNMVDLNSLNLYCCNRISDNGIAHLAKMVNLIDLNLGWTSITSAGLTMLASGIPRLASLELANCIFVNDACAHSLTRLTRLTHLDLSGTRVGDSMLESLADGAGVTAIYTLNVALCRRITDEAGRHLSRMINLRVVNLIRTSFGDVGLGHLANVVNSKIEILELGNKVTEAGLTHLTRLPRLRKYTRDD